LFNHTISHLTVSRDSYAALPCPALGIGLAASDKCLSRAIGMKINIPNLQRYEFPALSEGFVGDTEQGALQISSQAFVGALDKFP